MASRPDKCFGEIIVAKKVLSLLYVFCLTSVSVRAQIQTVFIDKQSGQLSVVEGYREDFVAWANFTDDIDTTG